MSDALGVYQPGNSPIHRLPAGFKLVALAVVVIAMTALIDTPERLPVGIIGVVAVFVLARLPIRVVLASLRPLFWVVLMIFGFQVIFASWERALVVCGVMILSVALAVAVSLTTRTMDMLAALTRMFTPLQRFGFRPDRMALVLALAIRAIPLVVELVTQVDEARRARGLKFMPHRLAVPVVLGSLHIADHFADALSARGLDD
ncbi:energy-coupling factor transporter transmembrane protein EcfT [Nocardia sp. 348MFTsu5.1]|uniref:energy-coupling factor transporter transmembrane component T family protein n=1 Tax=Nocardia sp. 348MFTsu5.1 TaxID=1172185 RepID=UPI00036B7C1F|nr:energy-coupling factor transporter transmembrane protein EcfT [Nocardia sp. 348MFTsu5.1]